MTNFDPELIAALAEGTLEPAEAEALERAIAADPAAAADLAAQREALAMLRDAPDVVLSIEESHELRAGVAEALGIELAPATPPPAKDRRQVPWPAIAVAGASLVALVAIIPTIGMLTTGSDDAGDVALPAATVAQEEAAVAESETFGTAREGADADNAAPTTTPAALPQEAPEAMLEADTAQDDMAADGAGVSTTMAPSLEFPLIDVDPALARTLEDFAALRAAADPAIEICRPEAVATLGEELAGDLTATLTMLENGTEAVVWFVPGFETLMEAAAFDSADCSLLFING